VPRPKARRSPRCPRDRTRQAPDDATEFLRAFGDAIRARRKEPCLSQAALADEIPLYCSYVTDVERAARNLGLVNSARIARALSVPLSQLLADAGERRGRS
jgi:ribosome-binding protein aMBF1 (putative translation factor)